MRSHCIHAQAKKILIDDFPFLDSTTIRENFEKPSSNQHYAVLHKIVMDIIIGDSPDTVATNMLRPALDSQKLPSDVSARLIAAGFTLVKKPRKLKLNHGRPPTDTFLLEEVDFVRLRIQEANDSLDKGIERRHRHAVAVADGATIECNCCFDDVAFEEMTQCDDGHLFCVDCLQRYASEQLFGQSKTSLSCMTSGDDGKSCPGTFDRSMLERALPKKMLAKLDEAVFTQAVEKAGLTGMARCPKCDYQVMLPDTEKLLSCPALRCFYESCRDCGEPPHFPLRCDEVERQNQTDGRKNIEEAMTEARVRECPDCKKRFFKTEGCNKMTCACGCLSCYICRAKVEKTVGYKHFCQVSNCAHDKCNKCPLFSNSVDDDRLAMREAGMKALCENQDLLLKTDESENGVDIDNLLESASTKTKKEQAAARAAQQNAHLGVGAMARAAYAELDRPAARDGRGGFLGGNMFG